MVSPEEFNERAKSKAACSGEDPELFFYADSEQPFSQREKDLDAKRICGRCVMITLCLEYALENEDVGTWGGMTAHERQLLRKRPPKTL